MRTRSVRVELDAVGRLETQAIRAAIVVTITCSTVLLHRSLFGSATTAAPEERHSSIAIKTLSFAVPTLQARAGA